MLKIGVVMIYHSPFEWGSISDDLVLSVEETMRILVIDDSEFNLESARETLAGHDLTTCSNADKALELLREESYDVVLSDLLMPAPEYNQAAEGKSLVGEEMPVGWAFVLKAALRGAKYVAVVCMVDHHTHPAAALIDTLGNYGHDMSLPNFIINGATAAFYHAPFREDGKKDWGQVLRALVEGITSPPRK